MEICSENLLTDLMLKIKKKGNIWTTFKIVIKKFTSTSQ